MAVRVDTWQLLQSACRVDATADDLRARHTSALGRVAAAQVGWVGSSAAALADRAQRWEEESSAHYAEILAHGEHLRAAAECYVDSDDDSGLDIDAVATASSSMGL